MDCKAAAKELRRIARGESKHNAKEFRELAAVVQTGDLKKAWRRYRAMDTFNREAINGDLMVFLYVNRTKGKKVVPVRIMLTSTKSGDEKLYVETELTFPVDADDDEMARAIMFWEDEQKKELLRFDYGDIKRRRE